MPSPNIFLRWYIPVGKHYQSHKKALASPSFKVKDKLQPLPIEQRDFFNGVHEEETLQTRA